MCKKVILIFTVTALLFSFSSAAYAVDTGSLTVKAHVTGIEPYIISPATTVDIYDSSNNLVKSKFYSMNNLIYGKGTITSGGLTIITGKLNSFDLPAGNYKVELKAAYFDDYTENVSVTTGGAVTIDGAMVRKKGSVKVKVIGRDVLGSTNGAYKLVGAQTYSYGGHTVKDTYLVNLSDNLNKEITIYLERERINPKPDKILEGVYVRAQGAEADYGSYSMGYGSGYGKIGYTDTNGETTFDDIDTSFLNILVPGTDETLVEDPIYPNEAQINVFVTPPESVVGSVTVQYRDKDTYNLLEPATVNSNLDLDTYSYTAKSFNNYTLVSSNTQSATLTNDNRSQTIIFDYKKNSTPPPTPVPQTIIKGSTIIQYINKDTGALLEDETVNSNLDLGTYSYAAKNFENFTLDDDKIKSATLTSDNRSQIIIFDYKKNSTPPPTPIIPTIIKGSTTIQYINEDTGALLEDKTVNSNLDLGTYSYTAKNFKNFTLDDDKTKSAILTESDPNKTIIFKYKKDSSSSHYHIDKDPDPVIPKPTPEEPVKPIITPPPAPVKKSVKGAYVVKYIDESGNVLALLDEKSYNNLDLGNYTELAKNFDGYNLNDEDKKSITLNESNLNGVIEFRYNKLPMELPKTGDNSKTNASLIIILLSALSSLLVILRKRS